MRTVTVPSSVLSLPPLVMRQSADEMAGTGAEPVVFGVGKGMGRWEAAAGRKESASGPSSGEMKPKKKNPKIKGQRINQIS